MGGNRHAGNHEDGFALVLVIFVMALISLLGIALAMSLQSHVRLASNRVLNSQAEAMADGGVELAVLSLITDSRSRVPQWRFPIDGQPVTCSANGARLRIKVQDTSGRVNLNLAGERLLNALFIGLGATREAASRATDLILDYRDSDNNRRPNGAELAEYEAAGRPTGPKNAPFDTVEELARVLDFDMALAAAAAPYLTVHSQTAGLDPRAVSPQLAAILATGLTQLPANHTSRQSEFGRLPSEFVMGSPQRVFQVLSEARLADGTTFVREAVLELQSTRNSVPSFKLWTRAETSDAAATDTDAPPC